MYVSNSNRNLIVVSFCVYLMVNLFENLIHYNIGRFSGNERIDYDLPNRKDWVKILVVMTMFAFLQGLLTFWFHQM